MGKKYILALDQGTTSSRCVIFDREQNVISLAQKEFRQIYPKTGWVEHDPMEIYTTQYEMLKEAIEKKKIDAREIAGIGIANQRETTIIWEKATGRPIYNAIVWQCRRTAGLCEDLKRDAEFTDYVRENTGLLIDAYFSATKIRWILTQIPGAQKKAEAGELLFGTVDTWLIWKLTNGKIHVTDYTNASRTMLFNIRKLEWDNRILKTLGIPRCMLPRVCGSSEVYGYTTINGVEVPICGIAGDQQAAMFGQTCFQEGNVKITYGTGNFILMNTGKEIVKSKNGLITTIAYGLKNEVTYALEGSVFIGGAVIQWLRDEMRFFSEAPDADYLGARVQNTQGVYFVPAFTGLGAPYWDMYARGTILGLTRGTTRNHIIRAALEAIAYQSKDVMDAMTADTGMEINEIKVDGGASVSDLIMQFQSDITRKILRRPVIRETTALGAAYLAGIAVGFWKGMDEVRGYWSMDKMYTPRMDQETREKLLKGWKKAVECARLWKED